MASCLDALIVRSQANETDFQHLRDRQSGAPLQPPLPLVRARILHLLQSAQSRVSDCSLICIQGPTQAASQPPLPLVCARVLHLLQKMWQSSDLVFLQTGTQKYMQSLDVRLVYKGLDK